MIRMHRLRFHAVCESRGVAVADAMACVADEDGEWLSVDATHPAYPRRPGPGLGDMVASGLTAIGITKERVEAVVGGPCGCPERQAWLNRVGAEWLGMPPGEPPPAA